MRLHTRDLAGVLAFTSCLLYSGTGVLSVRADQEKQRMNGDQEFASEYIQALEQLAKKHNFTMDEARRKAMLVHFSEPVFPPRSKVISDTLHVVEGPRNTLVLSGTTWTGDSKDHAELVVIHNGKVKSKVGLGPHDARQGTTIILFSPDRIDYLDWTTLRGGSFAR